MDYFSMIDKRQMKIFGISFVAVFIMAIFPQSLKNSALMKSINKQLLSVCRAVNVENVCHLSLVTPLPTRSYAFDLIQPKLEQKEDNFRLKSGSSATNILIPDAKAAGEYDNARAYAVVDFDSGEVVASKKMATPVRIASLTKIMTAVVALDLASPDELVTVNQRGTEPEPSKIWVKVGQKYTVEELLNAMLLSSANDAAEVVKEGVNTKYGEPVFIDAMNAKAKFLGLKDTHFSNPQGFDTKGHYSSAEDLAILSHYALKNYPLIREIVSKEYEILPASTLHPEHYLNNWNGLLGVYPGVTGIKIGNTDEALTTTVVTSTRHGKTLIAVLLGAPGILERDMWTAQLLDYGFEKSAGLPPVEITKPMLRAKYATWRY